MWITQTRALNRSWSIYVCLREWLYQYEMCCVFVYTYLHYTYLDIQ